MKPSRAARTPNCALSRYRLLSSALTGAKDISKALGEGCRTQAAFAALAIPSCGVEKVALNTLKATAEASIEIGGWVRLDGMRREYLKTLRSGQGRRRAAEPHAVSLTAALELERRVRVRLETAYVELLVQLATLAKGDPEIERFLKRHQAGFGIERMRAISGGRDGQGD